MDKAYWENISENYNTEIFDVLKSDKNGIIKLWLSEVASKKKTVGDVGCGIGKWLPALSAQFKEVFAIDISEANLKYCKKKYKGLQNIHYSDIDMSHSMKTSDHFDVILCVNAILTEVHSKRTIFFNNIYTNLNAKGNLILVVPSLESALFSAHTLDKINRKRGINTNGAGGANSKNEFAKFRQGVVNIDKVPTKHYLKEELISTLHEIGFEKIKIEKVEYSWNSEMESPPKSLKGPYPWDWVVMATKSKSGK